MVYESCKDLVRRAVSNKVLRDEVFNFTINSKYDGYQCGPASIIYRFNPTTVGGGGGQIDTPSGLSFSITFERLFV